MLINIRFPYMRPSIIVLFFSHCIDRFRYTLVTLSLRAGALQWICCSTVVTCSGCGSYGGVRLTGVATAERTQVPCVCWLVSWVTQTAAVAGPQEQNPPADTGSAADQRSTLFYTGIVVGGDWTVVVQSAKELAQKVSSPPISYIYVVQCAWWVRRRTVLVEKCRRPPTKPV